MLILLQRIKNKILLFISCIAGGVLLVFPQFQHRYPSLLDIAETVSTKNVDLVDNSERFRPLYLISRYVLANSFGFWEIFYFLFHTFLLGMTIFVTLHFINKKYRLLMIPVIVCLLINPVMIDSFWRIGSAEPILTFSILCTLYFLIAKKNGALFVSFILSALSKETFIFFIPIILWMSRNTIRRLRILGVISIVYVGLLLPSLINSQTQSLSYPSLLIKLNPLIISHTILSYGMAYWPILWLMFASVSYILYINKPDDTDNTLLLVIIASFIPVIITNNIQAYYLLPSFMLCIVLIIRFIAKTLESRQKIHTIIILSIISIGTLISIPKTITIANYWITDNAGDNALISWILKNPSTNDHISVVGRGEYRQAIEYILRDFHYLCLEDRNNQQHPYSFSNVTVCELQNDPKDKRHLSKVIISEELLSESPLLNFSIKPWMYPQSITKWRMYQQ